MPLSLADLSMVKKDSGTGAAGIGAEERRVPAAEGKWTDRTLGCVIGHFKADIEGESA